jgi:allantoate deiminase
MASPDINDLGARAETMIAELAKISAEPDRLIRLFLTPEHRRAADLVARWMRDIGMEVSEDALGTVRGRWRRVKGAPARKHLLIGSHIDTVIDAGKYDGSFGVIAGILAVSHLAQTRRRLPFDVDVLAFGDEEGSRFPSSLSSSSACAGVFDPRVLAFADRQGVTFADALKAYGKDARKIAAAAYRPEEAAGYVEVHIEQGPVLEEADEPLGVVTGIVGQSRMRVTVVGEAGHAGTVPMRLRRDALVVAAELVLAVEGIARENEQAGMVATVGRIEASPGAVNIIPGRVELSVDLRAMSDELRHSAVQELQAQAWRIVEARGLQIELEPVYDVAATQCALALQEALAGAISALGRQPVHLPSGAGHDAQMMAKLCPAAMLFVRCKGGISHNPAEFASPQDMGLAIAALVHFIENFSLQS